MAAFDEVKVLDKELYKVGQWVNLVDGGGKIVDIRSDENDSELVVVEIVSRGYEGIRVYTAAEFLRVDINCLYAAEGDIVCCQPGCPCYGITKNMENIGKEMFRTYWDKTYCVRHWKAHYKEFYKL